MNAIHPDEIRRRFARKDLTPTTVRRIEELTADFCDFAQVVSEKIPTSREASLALTALQEAQFWANEAIASNARFTDALRDQAVAIVGREHPAITDILDPYLKAKVSAEERDDALALLRGILEKDPTADVEITLIGAPDLIDREMLSSEIIVRHVSRRDIPAAA